MKILQGVIKVATKAGSKSDGGRLDALKEKAKAKAQAKLEAEFDKKFKRKRKASAVIDPKSGCGGQDCESFQRAGQGHQREPGGGTETVICSRI